MAEGIRVCDFYGKETPKELAFCPYCGRQMGAASVKATEPPAAAPAGPAAQKTNCSNCGTEIEASMKFCTKCGAPNQPSTPAKVEPMPASVPGPGARTGRPGTATRSSSRVLRARNDAMHILHQARPRWAQLLPVLRETAGLRAQWPPSAINGRSP